MDRLLAAFGRLRSAERCQFANAISDQGPANARTQQPHLAFPRREPETADLRIASASPDETDYFRQARNTPGHIKSRRRNPFRRARLALSADAEQSDQAEL